MAKRRSAGEVAKQEVAQEESERDQLEQWLDRHKDAIQLRDRKVLLAAVAARLKNEEGEPVDSAVKLTPLFNEYLRDFTDRPTVSVKTVQNILSSTSDKGETCLREFVLFLYDEIHLRSHEILRDYATDRISLWLEDDKHRSTRDALLAAVRATLDELPPPLAASTNSATAIADGLRRLSTFDLVRVSCICAVKATRAETAVEVSELLFMLLAECCEYGDCVTHVRSSDDSAAIVRLPSRQPVVAEIVNAAADHGSGRSGRGTARTVDLEWDSQEERLIGRAAICPSRSSVEDNWGLRQRAATGTDASGFADVVLSDLRDPLLAEFNRKVTARGVFGARDRRRRDWSDLESHWRVQQDLHGVRPYLLLPDIEGVADSLDLPRLAQLVTRVQVLCDNERRDKQEDLKTYLEELHHLVSARRR